MSHEELISPQAGLDHQALNSEASFPKWNDCRQYRRFSSHSPLATSHCLSNRNTPELRSAVTLTKQRTGQFLIATFRAFAATPPQDRSAPGSFLAARKLESFLSCFESAASKFLIDNFHRLFQLDPVSKFNQTRYLDRGRFLFLFAQPCARTSSLQPQTSSLQNLIAEIWKIRNRCNLLKTNGRRHF
jgi:hypothetical protein